MTPPSPSSVKLFSLDTTSHKRFLGAASQKNSTKHSRNSPQSQWLSCLGSFSRRMHWMPRRSLFLCEHRAAHRAAGMEGRRR
jgi:hypothetical protein